MRIIFIALGLILAATPVYAGLSFSVDPVGSTNLQVGDSAIFKLNFAFNETNTINNVPNAGDELIEFDFHVVADNQGSGGSVAFTNSTITPAGSSTTVTPGVNSVRFQWKGSIPIVDGGSFELASVTVQAVTPGTVDLRVREGDAGTGSETSSLSDIILSPTPTSAYVQDNEIFTVVPGGGAARFSPNFGSVAITAVPEPSSLALLGLSLFGCTCFRRRR